MLPTDRRPRRAILHGIVIAAGVILALGGAARAQQDGDVETALERVARDQGRIGLRLEGLAEKMERLAARYEDEGRTRNATLLRDALAEFEQRGLLALSRELERNLESGKLSTVEQQDTLSAALEDIYALLRDRRDVEDLSTQAALAREGVAQLGFLVQNERRLLSETRAATDQPDELIEAALKRAEQLAGSLDTASSATRTALAAEQRLGDAALAASLARQQRELAGEAQPRAATQALLEEALALLREHLDQPAAEAAQATEGALAAELLAEAESSRAQAREAAGRAAARMAAARAALQRAENGTSDHPSAQAEDGAAGAEGAPGEGGKLPGSSEPTDRPADPRAAARERMTAAADELDEVRDALDRSERSLAAARNRARAMATASSSEAAEGGEQMEELAQRLEAVEPEQGPELLDRTRELLAELSRMAQSAERGDLAGAQGQQQGAQASLNDMLEMLKARAAEAGQEPRPPADAQVLADLADRQAELEQRMRELMERLAEIPDQGFQQPMERSGQAMSGAESALRSGNSREATLREREAAEELEQAQKTLSGERDRYEQLRQEEVLFRLGEELTALLQMHEAARLETIELDTARAGSDRLGRSPRRAVSRLAGQERDLSVQAEALRATLQQNDAIAFTFALARCRDDLGTAAGELAEERTDALVQSVQADVSQRLRDLLAVLDDERERRRDAPTEESPPGQQPPEGRPQLVPTVAELLLIQRMEQAALARLESFIRLNPELRDEEAYSDLDRELLDRWASEHDQVSAMFRAMVDAGGEGDKPTGEDEGAPVETGEGEGGER